MIVEDFAVRLKTALKIRNMKASKLAELTKIKPPLISDYLAGKYKAKQDKVYLMAKALNVNEAWLMGFNVPMERNESVTIDTDNDNEQLLNSINRLTEEQKKALIQIIKSML